MSEKRYKYTWDMCECRSPKIIHHDYVGVWFCGVCGQYGGTYSIKENGFYISPEALQDIQNWTVDEIDDKTRNKAGFTFFSFRRVS